MSIKRGSGVRGLGGSVKGLVEGGSGRDLVKGPAPATPPAITPTEPHHRRSTRPRNALSLEQFRFQPAAGRSSTRTLAYSSQSSTERTQGHTRQVQVVGSNPQHDGTASVK
eukprot:8823151-Pyramimonas_sp.AAC.1